MSQKNYKEEKKGKSFALVTSNDNISLAGKIC